MSFLLFGRKGKFLNPVIVKSCSQIITCPLVGWWVGFGCGWAKLNVLQKRWLVCRLATLLILRRVGILSTVLCRFMFSTVGLLRLHLTHKYTHFLILPKIKKLISKTIYKNMTFNKIHIETIQYTYFVYCIFFSIRQYKIRTI